MKLWTIKFANGEYLTRTRDSITSDLNSAYVYHDPRYLIDQLEIKKTLMPKAYEKLVKAGDNYEVIEVKIVEA